MKLGKKLMVVAMAFATISMVGCNMNIGGHNMIEGDVDGATTNYQNEENAIKRELCRTKLKHCGGIFKISQTVNNKSEPGDGMFGLAFGLEDNKKELNFFVVGTSIQGGTERGYISYFSKIDEAMLDSTNFGAHKDGKDVTANSVDEAKNATSATEYPFQKLPAYGADSFVFSNNSDEIFKKCYDGTTYNIIIAVYPNWVNNKYDGSYNIAYYTPDSELELDEHKQVKAKDGKTVSPIKSFNLENVYESCESINDVPQGLLAYYLNVYGNQKVTGTWSLPSSNVIKAVVIEE